MTVKTRDEALIRTLIERWAEAVHRGDLEGVAADHAGDIVMYDVPPPCCAAALRRTSAVTQPTGCA
ncbi:hypothetical protein [Nonomuraea sp. NPDC049695]|uniref:hypothetical protein n=1 Tax=Nonomuraea sp. NPDC049695 TaxID=3154734 RepID=UPI00342E8ADF